MRIGYARVSTEDQNLDGQVDRLRDADCGVVYSEHVSGSAKAKRVEWDRCLAHLREGDTLVITRLDRAGRSLKHLLDVATLLEERGCALYVIEQSLDTSTSAGRALFQMLGVFAEFERSLISERTKEALRGRPRGREGGRPKALNSVSLARAQALYDSRTLSVREVASAVGVSPATLYRHLTLDGRA